MLAREVPSSFTLVRLRRGSGNADIRWFVGVLRKVLYVVRVRMVLCSGLQETEASVRVANLLRLGRCELVYFSSQEAIIVEGFV